MPSQEGKAGRRDLGSLLSCLTPKNLVVSTRGFGITPRQEKEEKNQRSCVLPSPGAITQDVLDLGCHEFMFTLDLNLAPCPSAGRTRTLSAQAPRVQSRPPLGLVQCVPKERRRQTGPPPNPNSRKRGVFVFPARVSAPLPPTRFLDVVLSKPCSSGVLSPVRGCVSVSVPCFKGLVSPPCFSGCE